MLTAATVVNLVVLSASLWLGFYIVTRSARSRVSWLAALTLWSMATFFLHNAVAINLPHSGLIPWLRPVLVFTLPFWFHLTVLLVPDEVRWLMWTPSRMVTRIAVFLAYVIAIALVAAGVVPTSVSPNAQVGTVAYLSGRTLGGLYPLAPVFLVLCGSLSLLNLWQGHRQATRSTLRQRFTHLLVATVLASLGGLYITIGVWLRLDLLTLPGDAALGAGVILLGYAVARYNALMEVRTLMLDFAYATLVIGLLAAVYYLAALILYFGGHVSFLSLMLVIVMVTSSHALYDGIRVTLDRLFYHEQFRQLRANLRALAQEAGTEQTLSDQLQAILSSLCPALRIRRGFIALRGTDGFVIEATQRADLVGQVICLSALSATEVESLPLPDTQGPENMTLLVPLYAGGAQVGALVLGRNESNRSFDEEDLELLEDLADQMATVIHTSRLQEENALAINEMVVDFRRRERTLQQQVQQMLAERELQTRPVLEGVSEKEFMSVVEDGLRRLYDFPYLGEHALAQMQVVSWQLEGREDAFLTHIDRGKALNEVLLQALRKLRPEGEEPPSHQVPPREWYQFLILHDAYVLGEPNRNIMGRLYISEGTFNRTRRRAIRGVAKALQEMEQEARRREA